MKSRRRDAAEAFLNDYKDKIDKGNFYLEKTEFMKWMIKHGFHKRPMNGDPTLAKIATYVQQDINGYNRARGDRTFAVYGLREFPHVLRVVVIPSFEEKLKSDLDKMFRGLQLNPQTILSECYNGVGGKAYQEALLEIHTLIKRRLKPILLECAKALPDDEPEEEDDLAFLDR